MSLGWRQLGALLPLLLVSNLSCAPSGSSSTDGTHQPVLAAGDLADIRNSGTLRILYPRLQSETHLPRHGNLLELELDLARTFAERQGLEAELVYVDSRNELLPSLLAGKGDLVAANLTVTTERQQQVAFTVPIEIVREQLVSRVDDPIGRLADLEGRRIAIRRSSSFWTTMNQLQASFPGIVLEPVAEDIETTQLIHDVANGTRDLTVADSNLVAACQQYMEEIRPALDLTRDRSIGWAVRPESRDLLASLNQFLTEAQLTSPGRQRHLGDLQEIEASRVLRVLTRNTSASYFLWRGRLVGFEYDLAKRFAERLGLRLEMIVPPTGEDLLTWLAEGRGDLIAAGLTPTTERETGAVTFSRPYHHVQQVVVARSYEATLEDINDLNGRTFHVRRSSSYWQTLRNLQAQGVSLALEPAPEAMETEEIIDRVASGEYDLTLADSHIVGIELSWRDDITQAMQVGEATPLTWVVRESSSDLLQAVDQFFSDEYRGEFYNVIYRRYFLNPTRIPAHVALRTESFDGFSPYDELVRSYAEQYGFDWRLIVSQMYQESRFNPNAISFAGARGLMQLLPRTAEELGFEDLEDPDVSIHAGVKYLAWVRDRFEPGLSVSDRTWFTLAAYNAGIGHVRDARRLAAQLGKNPNQWFGNVESAMALLSRAPYAEAARHGYCRCSEPINYVREIRDRYNAYVSTVALAGPDRVASRASDDDDTADAAQAGSATATDETVTPTVDTAQQPTD